jgi:monoamine oxidase
VEDLNGVQRYSGNPIDVPALRFVGGAASLASVLTQALPPGTLELGSPVRRIAVASHDDRSALGELIVTARDETWQARHVILALPPALAVATIDLPAELPQEIRDVAIMTPVWMGETVKVVAHYDEAFWRHDGLAGAAVSRIGPLQEMHDLSGPGGQPAALFGFTHPSRIGADAEGEIRAQLGRLFGPRAVLPTDLIIQDWSAERWTNPKQDTMQSSIRETSSHNYAMFGHPIYSRPALGGRLHWCSTETAGDFAGHMEGALSAADRAVAAILASTATGMRTGD